MINNQDIDLDPRLRELATSSYHTPIAPNQRLQDGMRFESPTPYLGETPGTDNSRDDGNNGPEDPKRPRACEACRGLKVRCEPDPNNPNGSCKRCAKANRECKITQPSRKRQKKTDGRVAELEKKVEALTASLQARSSHQDERASDLNHHEQESINLAAHARAHTNPYQQVTNGGYGSPYSRPPDLRDWVEHPKAPDFESQASGPPMVVAGQKRKHGASGDFPGSTRPEKSDQPIAFLIDDGSRKPPTHEYADVVDRSLITTEMADTMFRAYVEKMAPHMPSVVFLPGTTAADVRKNQPTLFLAILSSSSGSLYPKLQKALTKEIMGIYAQRVFINGEKTLELVQALHINTLWYYPPEHFEELKFYQLIHIAAVMAIDIGLGKKNKSKMGKAPPIGLFRDHPWRRTPYPDSESIEARRAWLSSYFLCANAAMGLRRPNLLRWTSFMQDCVEVLETSPDALPSDKSLCQWVKCQRIAEEVGTQFSMDDNSAVVSIADQKVQYALKGFELDLLKWSKQLTPESSSPTLVVMEHVVELYMHEVALHVDHNVEEFKPPFTEDNLRGTGIPAESDFSPLSPSQVRALSVCMTSIDGIFDAFLALDVDTVRCVPTTNFVRVAYAVVVLIKMYFAAAIPNSELGKIIDKSTMKVEQYLDGLVDLFKAASADDKSRPSAKFVMVLLMLKTWFHRQREVKPSQQEHTHLGVNDPSASDTKASTQENGQQPGFIGGNENTPLQLLSEVATGNSRGQSLSGSGSGSTYPNPSSSNSSWQDQQQQVSYPGYGPTASYSMNQASGNMGLGSNGHNNSNIDPSLGLDLGFSMGDNLEQAIGMTIGGGAFEDYFNDNSIFGGLMDNVGPGMSNFEGF